MCPKLDVIEWILMAAYVKYKVSAKKYFRFLPTDLKSAVMYQISMFLSSMDSI